MAKSFVQRALVLLAGLVLSVVPGRAVDYTWTNTAAGATGYWTNDILWGIPGNYPGGTSGDSAFLTNNAGVAGGTYTNLLNFSLPNSISTVVVSNSNNGQSWLVLTNATLNNDTLVIGSGGRLRVDNGGQLNTLTGVALTGTNSVLTINQGGIAALGGVTIASTSTTTNSLIVNPGGSLFVTNASGTAALVVGETGRGHLTLSNGTIIADRLSVTNGVFTFRSGILTTQSGAIFSNAGFIVVGAGPGLATWNVTGGHNSNLTQGITLGTTTTGTGTLFVTGPNTILATPTGTTGTLTINSGSQAIISNGANVRFSLNNPIQNGDSSLFKVTSNAVTTVTGGNAGRWFSGTTAGNQLIIEAGGVLAHNGNGLGFGGTSNLLLVTGTNSLLSTSEGGGRTTAFGNSGNSQSGTQPVSGNASYNTYIVSNGAWLVTFQAGGGSFYGVSNVFVVTGAGTTYSNQMTTSSGVYGWKYTYSNTMVIADGGYFYGNGLLSIDLTNTNSLLMVRDVNSQLKVGGALALDGLKNTVLVTNGGLLQAVGLTVNGDNSLQIVGGGANASTVNAGNGALNLGSANSTGAVFTVNGNGVAGSAQLTNVNTVTVGSDTSADNRLVILNGGLLEARSLITSNPAAGNVITNFGGTYQFSTNNPTVNPLGGVGSIALDSGVISFRAITNADVTANWGGGNQLTNISFAGNNTFRLNAATNTTLRAQTYTFDTGRGATNFTRLELVNGQTAYRNGNITIGAGGSLLISGTVASVTGVLTNLGVADVFDSTATLPAGVLNAGQLTLRNSTLTVTLTNTGTLRGNGTVAGNTVNAGLLAPGLSAGTLTNTGDLTLTESSVLEIEIGGTAPGQFDQLFVLGTLTLTGRLDVVLLDGFTPAAGDIFVVSSNLTGSVDGAFTNLFELAGTPRVNAYSNGELAGSFRITVADQSVALDQFVVVPEPSVLLCVLLGLGLLVATRWRTQRR